MSQRSRVVVSLALLGLAVLGGAGTAFAHDPIILTDTQTSPDAGPLLPDGTISFALYGTLNSAGDTRGLRVHFDSGDSVDITLLIPDRSPENELPDALLPTLRIDAPDGTSAFSRRPSASASTSRSPTRATCVTSSSVNRRKPVSTASP